MSSDELELRRARWSTAVLFFAFGALLTTWLSRLPLIKEDLALDNGELSLALLATPLGVFIALQVVTPAIDRWGSRSISAATGVASSAVVVMIGIASSALVLGTLLLALGLASGALDMAINTQGVAVERAYGRPLLSGLHGIYSVGGVVGSLVGAVAAGAPIDRRAHFAVAAMLLAIVCVLASRGLLGRDADTPPPERAGPAGVDDSPRLRRYPILTMLGLVAFCSFFLEGAVDNWSGIYLRETIGSSLSVAPLGAAAFACGMASGRLAGDAVIARRGRLETLTGAGILSSVGAAACVIAPSAAAVIFAFAVFGAAAGVIVPIAFGLAGNHPGVGPAWSISRVTTFGYVGIAVSPPVIGALAEATTLRTAFALLPPMALGVAFLGRTIRKRFSGQTPSEDGGRDEPNDTGPS